MKKYLLLFLLSTVCIFQNTYGQQIRFSKKYYLGPCGGGDGFVGVLPFKNYVIVAGAVLDTTCRHQEISIDKFDTNGNLLWEKIYGNPKAKCNYGLGFSTLIETKDSGYAGCGFVFDSTYVHAFKDYDAGIILCKFKSNGDTAWEKQYVDTNIYAYGECCKQTKDGGYIITGNYSIRTNPSVASMLLMKTDSLGNIQWQKTFDYYSGLYHLSDGRSIVLTSDGGYLVGGYCGSGSVTQYSSFVMKADSAGNEKWHSVISTNQWAVVAATADGGGIAACPYATNNHPDSKLFALKYSSSGAIQWQKYYSAPAYVTYVYAMDIVKDSAFVIAGSTTIDSNKHVVGFVTKIDKTGTMEWNGTYATFKDTNDQNYLTDIKQTPDGGYVACGFGWPYIPGPQASWLLKLDSNGCDTIGHCAAIVTGEQELVKEEMGNVKVFPNPASSKLDIAYNLKQVGTDAFLTVYDLLGNKVSEYSLPANQSLLTLNISNLSSGFYVYIIKHDNNILQRGKFIISRE